jgi:hypothetical protein
VSNKTITADQEQMGSTTFGNAYPAMIGHAVPAKLSVDRAGLCRVRSDGRT